MAAKLVIAPDVAGDLAEAYDWCEERQPGLGEDFLSSVDACIERICRTPSMYAKVYSNFRRALIRRFPYAVFYDFADDTITIYCIFHTSRDPMKWRRRLP